jgi:hypothetical protein
VFREVIDEKAKYGVLPGIVRRHLSADGGLLVSEKSRYVDISFLGEPRRDRREGNGAAGTTPRCLTRVTKPQDVDML